MKLILGILLLALVGCGDHRQKSYPIPTAALFSQLDCYDKKSVHVLAYASFSFENNAIWLNQFDCDQMLYHQGLWLEIPEGFKCKFEKGFGLCEIWGVVDLDQHGHRDLWPGTLRAIKIIEFLELPSK